MTAKLKTVSGEKISERKPRLDSNSLGGNPFLTATRAAYWRIIGPGCNVRGVRGQ